MNSIEADSLLDEEILESIYRVNRTNGPIEPNVVHKIAQHIPETEKMDYWLKKGDSLTIKVANLELPQRKGRPPPEFEN